MIPAWIELLRSEQPIHPGSKAEEDLLEDPIWLGRFLHRWSLRRNDLTDREELIDALRALRALMRRMEERRSSGLPQVPADIEELNRWMARCAESPKLVRRSSRYSFETLPARSGASKVLSDLACSFAEGLCKECAPANPETGKLSTSMKARPSMTRQILGEIIGDLRFTSRTVPKRPGFAIIAVLAVGLGIAASVTLYSVVDSFFLRPLPYDEPEDLVHVWQSDLEHGYARGRVSMPTFLDWIEEAECFSDLAIFNYTEETLTGGEIPERIPGARVSGNVYQLLGVEAVAGRLLTPDDDDPGAEPVMVISESLWEDRYDRSTAVLGETLRIGDTPYSIVGVVPAGFHFPLPITEIWLPRILDPSRHQRDARSFQVVGRLEQGIDVEGAQAQMEVLSSRLAETYPETEGKRGVYIEDLRSALNFGSDILAPMSVVFAVAILLVIIVACANLGGILLSRVIDRTDEFSVRLALGAGRYRIVRLLLTECLILTLTGGLLGSLLSVWSVDLLNGVLPPDLYRVGTFSLSARAIGVAGLLAFLTAVVISLVPSFRAMKLNVADRLKGLQSSGRTTEIPRGHALLVVTQTTLAIILIAAASVAWDSAGRMQLIDPGFRGDEVLTQKLILPQSRYSNDLSTARFHRDLVDRVSRLPGVASAATINYLPLNHETSFIRLRPPTEDESAGSDILAASVHVTPGFFQTLSIPLISGRDFTFEDDSSAPSVAIISRSLSRRLGRGPDMVGAQVHLSGEDEASVRIIGVAEDISYSTLGPDDLPEMYLPQAQSPWRYFRVVALTSIPPLDLASGMREAVWEVDPDLPVTETRMLQSVVAESLLPQKAVGWTLSALGLGALLLALIGFYGNLSLYVRKRSRELGIRMALGASLRDVERLLLTHAGKQMLWAAMIGIPIAYLVSSLLEDVSSAPGSTSPGIFLLVGAILTTAFLLSCWLPTRRARKTEVVEIMRTK